jgi:MoxR-like ATPase
VVITYPQREQERQILELMTGTSPVGPVRAVVSPDQILHSREVVRAIYVDPKIKDYVLDLIFATREPGKGGLADLSGLIAYGASPRATIHLVAAAKANAFLHGRGYVTPDDVKQVAMEVLQHRIIITYEAEAEEVTSADIVRAVLDHIEVP